MRLVAGCDAAYAGGDVAAAVVVLRFPELDLVEEAVARAPVRFPYVPGLLSFREAPALLRAFARLRSRPDAILCDAHGRAHPRRFGLASHLGALLGVPSVGCAKSRLVGRHAAPGPVRGSRSPLRDGGEILGAVLRTRDHVRPVFVSVGHRVTLRDAVWLVLSCCRGFRIPEPLRLADQLARRAARQLARPPPRATAG